MISYQYRNQPSSTVWFNLQKVPNNQTRTINKLATINQALNAKNLHVVNISLDRETETTFNLLSLTIWPRSLKNNRRNHGLLRLNKGDFAKFFPILDKTSFSKDFMDSRFTLFRISID